MADRHCLRCHAVLSPGEKADYCCVGCALLQRIPVDPNGNFPVTRELIVLIVGGVLVFNQLLIWGGAIWQFEHGQIASGTRLAWVHFVAALVVWLWQASVCAWQRAAAPRKVWLFGAITLGILISGLKTSPPPGAVLVAANAIFIFWNFRGAMRRSRRDQA